MTFDLRAWFADDPPSAFSYELGDLYIDLSNLLTDDVRAALVALAEQVDVLGRRDAMYAGIINITEDWAFTASGRLAADSRPWIWPGRRRRSRGPGEDRRLRPTCALGEWDWQYRQAHQDVVNIGIGGSGPGPVMVYEAPQALRAEGP